MSTPAIFLDRDGVIIENRANYVRRWEDVEFYPQALSILAEFKDHPYKIIVVTNQSAVGRGIISLAEAEEINNQIIEVVKKQNGRIDAAYICPHAPSDNCNCRKPQPGLLLQAAQEHDIDLTQSIMIGDAITDIQAGLNAHVLKTGLLLTGRGKDQAQFPEATKIQPLHIFADLTEALTKLLQ